MVKELMHDKVPEFTKYENFLKATNKSAVLILSFMNFLIRMNGFADAGYLQKKILNLMENNGIRFEAAPRKNMIRLMSGFECYHIKHQSIWDQGVYFIVPLINYSHKITV